MIFYTKVITLDLSACKTLEEISSQLKLFNDSLYVFKLLLPDEKIKIDISPKVAGIEVKLSSANERLKSFFDKVSENIDDGS